MFDIFCQTPRTRFIALILKAGTGAGTTKLHSGSLLKWATSQEKTVLGVCDQVRHKLACSAGCAGWSAALLFAYGKSRVSLDTNISAWTNLVYFCLSPLSSMNLVVFVFQNKHQNRRCKCWTAFYMTFSLIYTIIASKYHIYIAPYILVSRYAQAVDTCMCSMTCTLCKWAATWQNQQNESAPSEDLDQPGHPPSLIRVFAVRMKKPWIRSYPLSAQRRLKSDWADA